jgi:hypothetical protein
MPASPSRRSSERNNLSCFYQPPASRPFSLRSATIGDRAALWGQAERGARPLPQHRWAGHLGHPGQRLILKAMARWAGCHARQMRWVRTEEGLRTRSRRRRAPGRDQGTSVQPKGTFVWEMSLVSGIRSMPARKKGWGSGMDVM